MDREYWEQFYARPHPELHAPSPFARFSLEVLPSSATLFELGCGNGRDAVFFARHGLSVTACDQSMTAIEHLTALAQSDDDWPARPQFMMARFEDLTDGPLQDAIYSRFTMHTIDAATASRTLAWAHRNLVQGGRLLIEARTVSGDLYGRGEPAGRDAFVHDGHYRRFVRPEELTSELEQIGFTVEYLVEGTGLAPFGSDDPVVVRVIARCGSAPLT